MRIEGAAFVRSACMAMGCTTKRLAIKKLLCTYVIYLGFRCTSYRSFIDEVAMHVGLLMNVGGDFWRRGRELTPSRGGRYVI